MEVAGGEATEKADETARARVAAVETGKARMVKVALKAELTVVVVDQASGISQAG